MCKVTPKHTCSMDLGFVEKVDDPVVLTSPYFPSKVGGRPAWLDLAHLPAPEQLTCRNCGKPAVFLLQLYAPLDCKHPHAYHRTVYVFMCREANCHAKGSTKGFVVLRCQLGQVNDFYKPDESASDSETDEHSDGVLRDKVARKPSTTDASNERSRRTPATDSNDSQQRVDRHGPDALCEQLACTSLSTKTSVHKAMYSQSAVDDGNTINSTATGVEEPTAMTPSADSGEVVQSKPISGSEDRTVTIPSSLCIVCGCYASKKCAKCKQVNYCSREHQIHDWKQGHKFICSNLTQQKDLNSTDSDLPYNPGEGVLLPEFEIVREAEPEITEEQKPERSEEDRMKDYYKFVSSNKYSESKVGDGVSESELKEIEKASSIVKSDKFFKAFRKRVSIEPEQVIRYGRGQDPLLVSAVNIPSADKIPKCSCGAQRTFEFQVMPQLLYYLSLDSVSGASVDWGTLLVYTCAAGCALGAGYYDEFLWKQDFSN